jgi:hypothetical protein
MKIRVKREFVVKDEAAFRLRIKTQECVAPAGLISLNFIQECLNKDGEVDLTSTYNFFMTKDDINNLVEGLKQV